MASGGLSALADALCSLVYDCDASFGAIIDEGNGLWCAAPAMAGAAATANRFYQREMAPRSKSLLRGQRLSIQKASGLDRYAAESFAAIYVVVLWFDEAFEPLEIRRRICEKLPLIEALTLALPPFDGPDGGDAAQRVRA